MKLEKQTEIEQIFKKNYRVYCLLSYSYVSQWSVAEDIVQDVFVNLLTKKDNTILLNINAYVWRAIKNNSIKYVSRTKKNEPLDENCLSIPLSEEPIIEHANRASIIHESINKLPHGCKSVFELCALDGHKYNSAADQLGISVNTVKTQMKKAYKILRHDLKNYYLFILLLLEN
ncbi:sigma-70 family RNA polymerase sigma factor [Arenibacter palladensis]|uniref:sigma-70 family RNA polymerase sigma factor n=1 Tax=Arenibacter palladensis TaxID=237373 RepID=UPI0026E19551|nr:sigma-70 family RNA polymerase sigma factor [Arenibacter palladensis]MDO6603957.1 sigma-70 family RNA polymerase sigma factor [Arenibacter palladensis]